MDDEDNNKRFKILGFKPQKEKIYNKLLPYADELDEESKKLYTDIKTNLIKSIVAREMKPGYVLWTYRLNKYINVYGLKFSKEDHIALIKLYYDLLTMPNLELIRINRFASMLTLLLKKRYLITQDELQLEWRPLYDLCLRVLARTKKDIEMGNYGITLEIQLTTVIKHIKVYFPLSATQEILDEFRPSLYPFSDSVTLNGLQFLRLFLPLSIKPQHSIKGYKLWFEEFMEFWEKCQNNGPWETHMFYLIAKLGWKNIGYIDWVPYVPIMFTRFLVSCNLPVNFSKKGMVKSMYKLDLSAMAMWIVSILGGPNDIGFVHLEKFMQSLESYFHPANTGSWTTKIREFLKNISYAFIQRVHFERHYKRYSEYKTPDNYKLTNDEIDRFVNILKPSVELAIFSRIGCQNVSCAIQYLSTLRPNIICPIVLDKIYASMDSLTEPHRLTSSMMCLNAVARYLVQGKNNNYPEGPTHVIPLLMALLPGIDPNDIRKCFMTFNFITHFVNMVPLVNSANASFHYNDLTEEEHIICEASASFEDFVVQFFDRMCTWIESSSLEFTRLEQSEHDMKSKSESLAESALLSVITSVLTQSSPEIFQVVLKKIYNFATSRIFELKISGTMVATICQAFTRINPKETMKLFIPYLCETTERLFNESEDIQNEEHLNDELLYNMLLLTQAVDGRDEIVNYLDDLCRILDKTLHMKAVRGSKMAAHMLYIIMGSLSIIVPIEYRSLNEPYDSHIKDNLTIRKWGLPGNLNELNLKWYVPKEREINCVKQLINKYLVPELDRLNKYCSGDITLSREELRCSLNIIISILGCHTLLPHWSEPALQLVNSCIEPWAFELNVGTPGLIKLPDGRNIRKVIADTVHNVQAKLLEVDEGDTKSIHAIINVYDTLLFNKYKTKEFEAKRKNFHILKRYFEDLLHQEKKHLRVVLINRVLLHQCFRNESRSFLFSETHKQIILDLFELGVSRYSDVRRVAQTKIFIAVTTFAYSYTILIPKIKEILMLDSTEHHEKFKGCLYILLGPKRTPIVVRHDWIFMSELWPLIISSKPSEKLSIINLMTSIVDAVHRTFVTVTIKLEIPDNCINKALDLARNVPEIKLNNSDEMISKGLKILNENNESRLLNYHKAIDGLLNLVVEGNLHWRYLSMALHFIRDLVHYDVKYKANVVEYFLKTLINDSIIIRKIALKVVVFILTQNKPKFVKIVIDPYQFSTDKKVPDHIIPGIRPDNTWLLYNSKTLPTNDKEWDTTKYVHSQNVGFYAWPKELKVYAPSVDQPTPPKRMDKLTPQEEAIYNFFINENNVEILIKYFSMEEKKGKDIFNEYRFTLFKNLFKIFEDELLHIFLPHLQRLVEEKQEQYQRCAAEIISGIIRGSKHWSYRQIEKLWTELIPILRVALNNISTETITDWTICVTMAVDSRDPNRHYWLLEFLINSPLEEQSSYISYARLVMLKTVLNRQQWRNVELYNRLLLYFQQYMTQPFQNVREKISSCLSNIFSNELIFSNNQNVNFPRISKFFGEIMPKLDKLYENTLQKLEHSNNDVEQTSNQLQIINLNDDEKETSIRLFKITASYIMESVSHVSCSVIPEYYLLLPLACIMQSNDVDEELENVSLGYLSIISHAITLNHHMPKALEAIKNVSLCPFWSARAAIAQFISVFVFHNMATLVSNEEWIIEIEDVTMKLLEDHQPEVRVQASRLLSDLLHIKFIREPSEVLTKYKVKAKTKLKKRDLTKSSQINSNLAIRHAGVLGLCAFISSHPYDVPDFLPGIFSELGPHLNDPQPIPATIRKTLGDFKRTHHDNWEVHKLKFTEEELSVLSDLTVPPTYYA